MFKVVTWNVNSVNARLERVLAFLKRTQPDVLCLQELKCLEEKFPFEPIRALGYEASVYGQKTYNGVAILSRHPMTEVHKGFATGEGDSAARVISAKIKGVNFVCCYVPNGQEVGSEKYQYKLEWFQNLGKLLKRRFDPFAKVIVVGDFNVAPEDRDVYDPDLWRGKILCSDKERKALAEICDLGLIDCFRLFCDEDGIFSWWDYRALGFQKNNGLRIDFVLASQDLAKKCKNAIIDREERKGEKASDHAPVLAEFEL